MEQRVENQQKWSSPATTGNWLAQRLREGDASLAVTVDYRPDGNLLMLFRSRTRSVPLFLAVGRQLPVGTQTRFGTLATPSDVPRDVAAAFIQRTVKALDKLFPNQLPTWLISRAESSAEIHWNAYILRTLCGDLLAPGATRWADLRFLTSSFVAREGLRLSLGPQPAFDLCLAPTRSSPSGFKVGEYGPLTLTVPQEEFLREPLVRYIGFVLALSVPRQGELVVPPPGPEPVLPSPGNPAPEAPPPQAWWTQMGSQPFLVDKIADDPEVLRSLYGSGSDVLTICNMDRECPSYLGLLAGHWETGDVNLWGIHPSTEFLESLRTTDLGDQEILALGGESITLNLIKQAIQDPRPRLLVLFNSCLGHLMGDDVRRCLADIPGPPISCLVFDVCLDDTDNYRLLWDGLLELFADPNAPKKPGSVNLVGYGPANSRPMTELRGLLARVGLSDVRCILPTLNLDEVQQFLGAEHTFVYPSEFVASAFQLARRFCPEPCRTIPAPWGFQGTLRWLASLQTSDSAMSEDDLQKLAQSFLPPDWESLRARASAYSICFAATSEVLSDEAGLVRHGIPLKPFLEELGFGFETLLVSHAEPLGLTRKLATSNATLVYSEHALEDRALAAGKVPFSFKDLEMGFEGAVRTLRRLLRLAEVPFYRRFSEYGSEANEK